MINGRINHHYFQKLKKHYVLHYNVGALDAYCSGYCVPVDPPTPTSQGHLTRLGQQ